MAIDIASFRARFPEFKNPPYTDTMVQLCLDDSVLCVDEDRWDRFYEMGVNYLCAHELKINYQNQISGGNADAAGATQSETVDKVSYTNAINGMDVGSGDVRLSSTSYGLKYLELRDKVKIPGFMVV